MARRKKATPPAPWAIRIFWGLAIAVAVVLGPLLLMRADWMWGPGPSTAGPAVPTDVAANADAAQIRLKIELLEGKPWVVHGVADPSRAAAVLSCLSVEERGWEPVESAEHSLYLRRLNREGATADLYFVLNPLDTVADFLQYASGHESRSVPAAGVHLPIGAGGRAHVVGLFSDTAPPDLSLTPSPVPAPAQRAKARAAFAIGEGDWNEAIVAAGAYPLPLRNRIDLSADADADAGCDWIRAVEVWLVGVPPAN